MSVGADADELVGLVERMVVGHAVDGGRGDVDDALDARLLGGLEDVLHAVDLGGVDVLLGVEREGRRRVDDPLHVLHALSDEVKVADVAEDMVNLVLLRVVKGGDVDGSDFPLALVAEIADHVDGEKAAAARYQNPVLHFTCSSSQLV